jgi:hypothetical protein
MNTYQKGALPLVVGILIVIALALGGSYYIGTKQAAAPATEDPNDLKVATTTQKPTTKCPPGQKCGFEPVTEQSKPVVQDPIIGWKTYRTPTDRAKAGNVEFVFNYPSNYKIVEDGYVTPGGGLYPVVTIVPNSAMASDLDSSTVHGVAYINNNALIISSKVTVSTGKEWTCNGYTTDPNTNLRRVHAATRCQEFGNYISYSLAGEIPVLNLFDQIISTLKFNPVNSLVTITSPKYGDVWKIGETRTITLSKPVSYTDVNYHVVLIAKDGKQTGIINCGKYSALQSSYTWIVGSALGYCGAGTTGKDVYINPGLYKIVIKEDTSSQKTVAESGYFSIVQ